MPLLDTRTLRIVFTILLIAACLAFAWAAWRIIAAFVFAIFFAYLVDPVVQFVCRRLKLSRGKSILVVYLVIFAGLAALFLFIGPLIVAEGQTLAKTLPDLYEKIASGQIAWQFGEQHGWSFETKLKIQQFLSGHREVIIHTARDFGTRLADAGRNAWWLLLIPILAVFFLLDGEQFRDAALEVFERRKQREFVQEVLEDVHLMLAHYIRAQLLLAAIAMMVYVIGLSVMRAPYGFILGIIGGFLEFLPMVGPLLSYILMMGVAIAAGYSHPLLLLAFLLVWRGLQDYVVSPRIMGKSLELHPLAALFGILAGGEVAGIIGVFLSIPVMAMLRIFWRRWRAFEHTARTGIITPVAELSAVPSGPERDRSA